MSLVVSDLFVLLVSKILHVYCHKSVQAEQQGSCLRRPSVCHTFFCAPTLAVDTRAPWGTLCMWM